MDKAWEREVARFHRDYNDKLFNGLLGLTFLDIVLFRFVIRISLMETVGWLGFAFLQVILPLQNEHSCTARNTAICCYQHALPGVGWALQAPMPWELLQCDQIH